MSRSTNFASVVGLLLLTTPALANLALALPTSAGTPQPLNSSILLLGEADFERCPALVDKAYALGNERVNLVPTLHVFSADQKHVDGYCFNRKSAVCEPLTEAHLARLKKLVSVCAQRIFGYGMRTSIVPHLDDALGAFWRNGLDFDPAVEYRGHSYRDAMLGMLMDGLIAARPRGSAPEVDFSLEGEMGGTIFNHPDAYIKLLPWMRQTLAAFRARIGVSVNFNMSYGFTKPSAHERVATQALINKIDFLGISNYHSVSTHPVAADFSKGIDSVLAELGQLKLTLAPNKEIQFSEIGIGGGTSSNHGTVPATNPSDAASTPWAGSGTGVYDPALDPWATPRMEDFRYEFHRALLDFLATQPHAHFVGAAYLWSMSSWDPQGVYFDDPQFRDERIIDLIRDHSPIYSRSYRRTLTR